MERFTASQCPHGVTMITDLSGVHCFLVEGREKALLIDAMTGLRGLKDFVATLTDLPVEVAATHGHMDHVGGVFEFGGCYIHPLDMPMLAEESLRARVSYVKGQLEQMGASVFPQEGDFVPDSPVTCRPVRAGTSWTWAAAPWRFWRCRATPRALCAIWTRRAGTSSRGTPATTTPW